MSEPHSPTRDGRLRRGLRALLRWFDTADEESAATEPDRIAWLRVLPFIGLHLACLGVIWVGVSAFAVAWRGALCCCACSRSRASTTATFSHKRVQDFARDAVRVRAARRQRGAARAAVVGGAPSQPPPPRRQPEHDMHSPVQHGFWLEPHGLVHDPARLPTDFAVIRDLAKYPELRWLDRFDILVPVALAVPCSCSAAGWKRHHPGLGTSAAQLLIWGFFVSTVVLFHATVTINSLAHRWGRRRYETRDDSRNNGLAGAAHLRRGLAQQPPPLSPVRRARASTGGRSTSPTTAEGAELARAGMGSEAGAGASATRARADGADAHRGHWRRASPAWVRRTCSRQHDVTWSTNPSSASAATPTRTRVELAARTATPSTRASSCSTRHYPLLTRLFGELGVESQPTIMSFSVQATRRTGLEYNATNLGACSASGATWCAALLGHGARHPALLPRGTGARWPIRPGADLGDYLYRGGYGALFIEDHLLPMASRCGRRPRSSDGLPGEVPGAVHGQPPDAADPRRANPNGGWCAAGQRATCGDKLSAARSALELRRGAGAP
jgi:stearoyl-CoA desaturase (delta-9 desaturase)